MSNDATHSIRDRSTNQRGYAVNAIVTNQLHADQRSDAVKPTRAQRRRQH